MFSALADQKEPQARTLLFTEDATSETTVAGQGVSSLKGRKQLGDACGSFLPNSLPYIPTSTASRRWP